jgi:hypothetical protein
MVHGAGAAQALLQAGQLDELEIHLIPVLPSPEREPLDSAAGSAEGRGRDQPVEDPTDQMVA